MDVRNCVKCGRLFNYIGGSKLCASCKKELEETFKEVKNYIRKNPDCSIVEVTEACDVDTKQIKQWVREERLAFKPGSNIGVECELCGTSISIGRYCEKCKSETLKNLNAAKHSYEPEPETEELSRDHNSRMRFLGAEKK